ncbi:serum paraoxonase/arylesterase 2-like [Asterias amurensis]|uniref:serum paraoxonase/arylesterase 2-like n=1 Tax=Asterias amurensis TaxID=7602 RepID=UPI003AB80D90
MIKTVIIGVSVLLVVQHVLSFIYSLGFHKWAYNHRPGPCRVVPGIETGSEDIQVLASGLALITSGIELAKMGLQMDPSALKWKGRIYAFDLNDPNGNVSEVAILGSFDEFDFRPHGIGVWQDQSQTRVFVVNHKKTHEAIEVFQFDEEKRTLTFLHSITGPSLRSVNDVVAVGPDSLYFTNDGYNNQFVRRFLEMLFKFPWGNVVFYDGKVGHGTVVVKRGLGPNGINISPDKRFIYVAFPYVGVLTIYERQSDNSLNAVQVIDLGTGPDNIYVDPATGDLWIGCHPIAYQAQNHFKDFTQVSTSQVLRVRLSSQSVPFSVDVTEAYVDDGKQISGSTIAIFYNNQLLIGSVCHKLAHCQVLAF